ncbi:MAG: cytidylate kinase-like family protein [Rhodothermales bacterium]|nr:cytidylate kinase-like family protein [Rhodothermales bacterium]
MAKIEEIVGRQVAAWGQSLDVAAREGKRPEHWPIITVSREFGARGAALAGRLCERLEFSLWHKELVQAIAEDSDASEDVMASLDERRQKSVEDAVLGALMGSKVTNVQYVRSLMRLVQVIAIHGSAVIVGRGANFICKPDSTLRLRVVSPLDDRVSGYSRLKKISEREARQQVVRTDAERADFVQHHFRSGVDEAWSYDMVLNSSTYSLDDMVEIVLLAYRTKFGRLPKTA